MKKTKQARRLTRLRNALAQARKKNDSTKTYPKCPLCPEPLTEKDARDPQGPQFIKVDGKDVQVHADCYFEMLGNEIEKHPIGRPRTRVGAGPI